MQNTGVTGAPFQDPFQVLTNWSIAFLIVAGIVGIIVWVYMKGYPEIEKGQTRKPQLGIIVLVILAIFSPEAIRVSTGVSGPDIVLTAMWLSVLGIVLAGNSFNPSFYLFAIPLTFLRLVFPLMMYRYYQCMTSRRYVIIAGVLVDLTMLIFGFPLLILLIVGLGILWFVPVPTQLVSWPEQEMSGVPKQELSEESNRIHTGPE